MEIREASAQDLTGLLRLYGQLKQEPVPEPDDRIRSVFDSILTDGKCHILVGTEEGCIVSTCTVTVIPNLTHGQRPYAVVENVVSDEKHRGRGFASAVLDRAKELAKSAGCYKIMLMTGSKQESTLRFYERAGYNRTDKTGFVQWL